MATRKSAPLRLYWNGRSTEWAKHLPDKGRIAMHRIRTDFYLQP